MKFDISNTYVDGTLYGKAVRDILTNEKEGNWTIIPGNSLYSDRGTFIPAKRVNEMPPVGVKVDGKWYEITSNIYYVMDTAGEEEISFV